MADELRHYTSFVRSQPCAACGTKFQMEVHHALYGTTYSPAEPIPAKAIPNARKGGAQRSHDWFSIPLCLKDHTPGLHKSAGFFAGRSGAWLEDWERAQVDEMHRRYDAEFPNGDPALAMKASRAARPRANVGDVAHRERLRIASWLRDKAGERHLKVNEAAVLVDAAAELEQQSGEPRQ